MFGCFVYSAFASHRCCCYLREYFFNDAMPKKKISRPIDNSCAAKSTIDKCDKKTSSSYSNPDIDKLFADFEQEIYEFIDRRFNELLDESNNSSCDS